MDPVQFFTGLAARRDVLRGSAPELIQPTPDDGLSPQIRRGVQLRRQGRYDEAVREFERALEHGEDGARATEATAELHLIRGEPQRALALYEGLLAEQPDRAKLWNERGVCLHHTGDTVAAAASYGSALERDPGYALAWNNRGVLRAQQNDLDEAERALREAVALRSDFADGWCNLALLGVRRERPTEALVAFRAAIDADPGAAVAWCGVGNMMLELRRPEEARSAFARAVEADPDRADTHYGLSFALAQLNDFPGALRETKRALELDPFYSTPGLRLAIELQWEPSEMRPPELDATVRIGGDERGIASFALDESMLDDVFQGLTPAAPPPLPPTPDPLAAACDSLARGQLERAQEELRRAPPGADPVETALLGAEIYLQQGFDGEARERFDAALAGLNGSWGARHGRALLGRARALLRLGALEEAALSARKVLEHDTGEPDALRILGETLLLQGDGLGASAVAARALLDRPDDAGLLRQAGLAAWLSSRYDDATALLREALEAEPELVAARVDLARLLLEGDRPDEAAAECRAAIEVLPSYSEAALVLARAEQRAGRPERAIAALVALLELDPTHLDALTLLGRVLLDGGRRVDARHAFRRVLRFDPRRADALFYLGVDAGEEQRFREAIEWWQRSVEAAPEGPLAAKAKQNIATTLGFARIFHS